MILNHTNPVSASLIVQNGWHTLTENLFNFFFPSARCVTLLLIHCMLVKQCLENKIVHYLIGPFFLSNFFELMS